MNHYYSICAMLRYMNAIHIQIFRYSAMTKTILVATRITYDTKHIYSPMVSIRWGIRLCWTLSLIVRQNPYCRRLCYITDGLVICIINPHRRQIISNNSRISWLSIIQLYHSSSFQQLQNRGMYSICDILFLYLTFLWKGFCTVRWSNPCNTTQHITRNIM